MKDFWLFLKGNKIFIVHTVLWNFLYAYLMRMCVYECLFESALAWEKPFYMVLLYTLAFAGCIIVFPVIVLGTHGGVLFFLEKKFGSARITQSVHTLLITAAYVVNALSLAIPWTLTFRRIIIQNIL